MLQRWVDLSSRVRWVDLSSREFEDQDWNTDNDICAVKIFKRTNNLVGKVNMFSLLSPVLRWNDSLLRYYKGWLLSLFSLVGDEMQVYADISAANRNFVIT